MAGLERTAERVARYSPARTGARPPQQARVPRKVPLSRLKGATPTRAAMAFRSSVPSSGSSRMRVAAVTGPIPLTVRSRASASRQAPPGDWYSFWTGTPYVGGRWINVPVTLDSLPLFVKAGTILPLGPIEQYVGERGTDELTLRVFPERLPSPPRAGGLLHEDGGTTRYTYADDALVVEPEPGAPQARTYRVVMADPGAPPIERRTEGAARIDLDEREG